jgi:hypothetical protein
MDGQNMNKDKWVCLAIIIGLVVLSGCSSESQMAQSEPACLQTTDKSRIMEIGQDVLTRMNFVIEKYDVEAGFVNTQPLRAGQVFEFWRTDNVGTAATAEASLHSIRRTAQLTVSTTAGRVCTTCEVGVERLSLPAREITGMSWLAGMFTDSGQAQQRLTLRPEQAEGMAWINLGRDGALEKKILASIEAKFSKLEGQR